MNYRKYKLFSGREVFAGRNAENNDELVRSAGKKDVLLHTQNPGSPFVNVGESPTKEEINEAAVFCARYSQGWRDYKKDVVVNVFKRSDMKKNIFMKTGTWKVKHSDNITVKKIDIESFEDEAKIGSPSQS